MLETIIVSALTALVTSRIMAFYYLKVIDRHSDKLLNTVKEFLDDLISTLSKRH